MIGNFGCCLGIRVMKLIKGLKILAAVMLKSSLKRSIDHLSRSSDLYDVLLQAHRRRCFPPIAQVNV